MGVCRICQGGGTTFFGGFGQVASRETLASGVRGHAPPRKFLNGAIWIKIQIFGMQTWYTELSQLVKNVNMKCHVEIQHRHALQTLV